MLIAEQFKIEYYLYENLNKIRFYLIPLDSFDNKEVKKKDIEKMSKVLQKKMRYEKNLYNLENKIKENDKYGFFD